MDNALNAQGLHYCPGRTKDGIEITAAYVAGISRQSGTGRFNSKRLPKGYGERFLEKGYFQTAQVIFFGLLFFIFFCLLYLFHKVALAVAVQPRAAFVDTQCFGYIVVVQLKTSVNKEARTVGTDQRNQQHYSGQAFEHWRKDNGLSPLYRIDNKIGRAKFRQAYN
jgi:hypothetical protein